ncbi:hypothetical protein Peur_034423 [Populus x canadensis]
MDQVSFTTYIRDVTIHPGFHIHLLVISRLIPQALFPALSKQTLHQAVSAQHR